MYLVFLFHYFPKNVCVSKIFTQLVTQYRDNVSLVLIIFHAVLKIKLLCTYTYMYLSFYNTDKMMWPQDNNKLYYYMKILAIDIPVL